MTPKHFKYRNKVTTCRYNSKMRTLTSLTWKGVGKGLRHQP